MDWAEQMREAVSENKESEETQGDAWFLGMVVRPAVGDPMSITLDVRQAVQAADPHLRIFQVRSIAEVIDLNAWFFQVFGVIFIIFGVVALFIASVGLYGVLAHAVSRRVRGCGRDDPARGAARQLGAIKPCSTSHLQHNLYHRAPALGSAPQRRIAENPPISSAHER